MPRARAICLTRLSKAGSASTARAAAPPPNAPVYPACRRISIATGLPEPSAATSISLAFVLRNVPRSSLTTAPGRVAHASSPGNERGEFGGQVLRVRFDQPLDHRHHAAGIVLDRDDLALGRLHRTLLQVRLPRRLGRYPEQPGLHHVEILGEALTAREIRPAQFQQGIAHARELARSLDVPGQSALQGLLEQAPRLLDPFLAAELAQVADPQRLRRFAQRLGEFGIGIHQPRRLDALVLQHAQPPGLLFHQRARQFRQFLLVAQPHEGGVHPDGVQFLDRLVEPEYLGRDGGNPRRDLLQKAQSAGVQRGLLQLRDALGFELVNRSPPTAPGVRPFRATGPSAA